MRAGFGLSPGKYFLQTLLRRPGLAAMAGLLFALQPLSGAGAQSPERPRNQSGPAAKPKPATKKPNVTRAPARKATPPKPAANPRPAANPKPAANPRPAAGPKPAASPAAPAPAPEEPQAAAAPPTRTPVDVVIEKLKPYNLPPASREKMHECGDEWRQLKLAGQAKGQTWRLFAEKCLPR
jgi:hypothetical protein